MKIKELFATFDSPNHFVNHFTVCDTAEMVHFNSDSLTNVLDIFGNEIVKEWHVSGDVEENYFYIEYYTR